ncbi:hypothetical protein H0266_08045 [Halobacillus locisalis]|uniref:Uncharacterized protein n=1 Tax=Halobacillus locisalis TaxID=220753 RepID=A0A838CSB3_9BACI|nr:hypothetical protein [Halobacillus locisalis]MBA2174841.1 hypothetical protein [Halobacillus locisalis]
MLDNPELIKASAQLGKYITQQSTVAIRDKLRISKEAKSDKEKINVLEEIIQELLAEKNQLIQIAQVYDEQMVAQKISEEDVDYITSNILPLFENLITNTDDEEEAEENRKNLDIFKPLLSKETFNMLQLLGFNYKRAIGEPLTDLVNAMIVSQKPISKEADLDRQKLFYEHETQYFNMINDEEAYQRHLKLQGKE